jgi:hypothetical protein
MHLRHADAGLVSPRRSRGGPPVVAGVALSASWQRGRRRAEGSVATVRVPLKALAAAQVARLIDMRADPHGGEIQVTAGGGVPGADRRQRPRRARATSEP